MTTFATLKLASWVAPHEGSAIDDFVLNLFRALRDTRKVCRSRKDLRFLICDEEKHAKTDGCVIDLDNGVILLMQEDGHYLEESDPQPQLIAEAIAAFTKNNYTRTRALGLPALEKIVRPRTHAFVKIPKMSVGDLDL